MRTRRTTALLPSTIWFADLEMDNPDHIALKYYRSYHSGSAKTLKSIQITLAGKIGEIQS